MTSSLGDVLLELSARLATVAAQIDDARLSRPLAALLECAERVGRSWSHSCLGYHALVYYEGFRPPPPGAHFSPEWGLMEIMRGTTGDWREYTHDEVTSHIEKCAGRPDLEPLRDEARQAERVFRDAHDDTLSVLRAELRRNDDEHLRAVLDRAVKLKPIAYTTYLRSLFPAGQVSSRDAAAISNGFRSAPHQELIGQVVAIRSPFEASATLAHLCRSAARHLERVGGDVAPTVSQLASRSRIVIGHGQSPLWRELKDFVADRLGLPWDEFNRVAIAGVATVDRLQQMLEGSAMALLVATAEDELADGSIAARQNVVHEIGLFQGHLGFGRAIVLLEAGCAEFSNIHGLGQLRFPKGDIAACFEEVRRVLEREGVL